MPVRRVVMAEDLHRAQDLDPVAVGGHQKHRVPRACFGAVGSEQAIRI
jgi:hypothetical protein